MRRASILAILFISLLSLPPTAWGGEPEVSSALARADWTSARRLSPQLRWDSGKTVIEGYASLNARGWLPCRRMGSWVGA